jgi:CTP:phosphocholine cytidylyltransferase-like protein
MRILSILFNAVILVIDIIIVLIINVFEYVIAFLAILLFNNPDYEPLNSQEKRLNFIDQMNDSYLKLSDFKPENFDNENDALDFINQLLKDANRLYWTMILGDH